MIPNNYLKVSKNNRFDTSTKIKPESLKHSVEGQNITLKKGTLFLGPFSETPFTFTDAKN
jgi:hypothetical protein